MNNLKFTKMHGLGNDFIIIDDREKKFDFKKAPDLAKEVCQRNFGVGADGLVFLRSSQKADFAMRIFNSDGSEAEMCGNAIRCLAKYVFDKSITASEALSIETLNDVRFIRMKTEQGKASFIQVDMGEPILDSIHIPVTGDSRRVLAEKITVSGQVYEFTAVSMGNPHCIIFVTKDPEEDLTRVGALLERHPFFPEKTNVEFVQIINREEVRVWVFERGVGPTLACGTGACATVVAAVLNGLTDRKVKVNLPGGSLEIIWSEDGRVFMEGPAEFVFSGTLI